MEIQNEPKQKGFRNMHIQKKKKKSLVKKTFP